MIGQSNSNLRKIHNFYSAKYKKNILITIKVCKLNY